MTRDPRMKCGRCRRYMRRTPTPATPLQRAARPHDKVCVDCAPASQEFRPVSAGQLSALHAKCNALGFRTADSSAEWKTRVKDAAAEKHTDLAVGFSFRDLSYEQASWCLDWLDEQQAHAFAL